MREEIDTDIAIVGAGIAGAGLAAALGPGRDVVLLEREPRPGHHATGRSAAIFIRNYGNAVIRALSRASATHFEAADPDYFPAPLLTARGILFVANEEGRAHHEHLVANADGLVPITPDEAVARVPLLRREWMAAAAFEADAMDIDVAALHQGWLKQAGRAGARIVTNAEVASAGRENGRWRIDTPAGTIRARVLVNAAGAWADRVAEACGVAPLGLVPMRRSMAVLPAPQGFDMHGWPLVADAADTWYFKPDAGRLLVSPADEDPVEPHDAYVDDMVLAEGLDRYEKAVVRPVTRVESSWAGLRTFAPDRTPVAGYDPVAEGFFWLAGQGGYGIQTAPALSRLAATALLRASPESGAAPLIEALSPARFPLG